MPKRIQRQRTRGWRMPEGVVYVGRPTKWGNPWTPENCLIVGVSGGGANVTSRKATLSECVDAFRESMERDGFGLLADLGELRGKDLACWCPLDRPCHADILLELANAHVPDRQTP